MMNLDYYVYQVACRILAKFFGAIAIVALIGGAIAAFCLIFLRKTSKYYVGPEKGKVIITVLITVVCVGTLVFFVWSVLNLLQYLPMYLDLLSDEFGICLY